MLHFRHHSTTNQRPGDAFRRQQETWRRAYTEAGSLRERFPAVEQVIVEMTFTDVRKMGVYSAQMRSFSSAAKAFFSIPCPRTLCLDGGFDLDSLIVALLETRRGSAAGTLECAGWVDPARSEHAHCLLQLNYRIEVHYDLPEPAASKRRPA
jgi:hypothetical protein